MRVLLDTNVLISALISKGKPNNLLNRILVGNHSIILSETTMEELSRIARDEKIRRYADDAEFETFLRALLARATFVQIKSNVMVFNDPDDLVLGTAKDGRADFIVTGDKHLLKLSRFKGIKIITVAHALRLIK